MSEIVQDSEVEDLGQHVADMGDSQGSFPAEGPTFTTEDPSLSKSHKTLKWILVFANFLFLVFACVCIGVGAVALNSRVGVLTGVTLPAGLIVIGVFIMILSFFGCFGAWMEKKVVLGIYFACLCILTIILLSVGIAVYVKKDEANTYIEQGWKSASDDIKDVLQHEFQCCGYYTYADVYQAKSPYKCPENGPKQACQDLLIGSFNKNFVSAGGVGIAFAVLMIVFQGFVACLIRGIQTKQFEEDLVKLRSGADAGAYFTDIRNNPNRQVVL